MTDKPKNHVADVGVRLVVDSNAKAVADDLKHSLTGAEVKADKAAKGIKGKLASLMKSGAGMMLSGVTLATTAAMAAGAGLIGLAHHSAEAFEESEEQVRSMAGAFMLVDKNANAFEKLVDLADDVKNELEDIAVQAGTTDDEMVAVFNDIIERGGKSVDQATQLAEAMAFAGRAIPGGASAMAAGFEAIQMGIVKAKNPLVGMIAATGTLKGSAKSVAKEMSKMSIAEQMELAEKAIEKMAGKMRQAPMTLGQMKKSMSVVIGNVFEEMGKPIVKALDPIMGRITKALADNQEGIYEKAAALGEQFARAVEIGGLVIDETTRMAKETWHEIEGSIDELSGPFREAWEYIYENKEAFARTVADGVKLMITAAKWIIKAFTFMRDTVFGVIKALGKSGIVGADTAKYIGEEERGGTEKEMRSQIMKKGGISNDEFEKYKKQIVDSAQSTGTSVPDALKEFDAAYRRAMDDHMATMTTVEGARDAAMTDDAKKYAQMFDVAAKAHDTSAMQYVAKFIEGNQSLANAIAKEGPDIFKEGFDTFLKTLKDMGDKDIADQLKKAARPNLGIPAKGNIIQNFNGPINVKQDFRDQDPDRVMVMMKRDFARAGVNRLQARTGGIFGF